MEQDECDNMLSYETLVVTANRLYVAALVNMAVEMQRELRSCK